MRNSALYLRATFDTIGNSAVITSQWCVLQAFVQATMWHNTEPLTLGISIWATVLFGSVCFHGFLSSFFLTLCKIMDLQHVLLQALRPFVFVFIRSAPAIFLVVASLPALNNDAACRTSALYCGVFFTVLHIVLQLSTKEWGARSTEGTTVDTIPEANQMNNMNHNYIKDGVGRDVVIGVFMTMGLRWCFWGINIFYEYWEYSVILMVVVVIHSFAALLIDTVIFRKCTLLSSAPAQWKEPRCTTDQSLDVKSNVTSRLNEKGNEDVLDGSGESFLSFQRDVNENKPGSHYVAHTDEDVEGQNSTEKQPSSKRDGTIDSTKDCDDCCCSKTSCLNIVYYYFGIAPAVGSLAYLFIWIFTSPTILCMWGEMPDYPHGYLIFLSFLAGCITAVIVDAGGFCRMKSSSSSVNNSDAARVPTFPKSELVLSTVCIVMIIGVSTVLFASRSCFFSVGAVLLAATAPMLVRILLSIAYQFLRTEQDQRSGREKSHCWRVAVFVCVATLFFTCHHFIAIVFIIPARVTDIFHGRMEFVMYPLVLLSTWPIIFISIKRMKVNITARLRSSSTSPLLPPGSPLSQNNPEGTAALEINPIKSTELDSEIHTKRKYRISSRLSFLVMCAFGISVAKHILTRPDPDCIGQISNRNSCLYPNETLRVISWNVLLGHTYTGRSNLDEIVSLVKSYNPHVLALQEATGHPPYWGGKDIFGYVEAKTGSCRRTSKVVNAMKGTLEVGMSSTLPINSSVAQTLSNRMVKKFPTYTMVKASLPLPQECHIRDSDPGSRRNASRHSLHIYTLHAFYKNWTCSTESGVSCDQMKFVHDDIRKLHKDDPVIVMGDFNINPSEPELDTWFYSDLGFKSALWPERNSWPKYFNYTCKSGPKWNENICDCKCRKSSSDPRNTTVLNRRAAVDHIFFRGLDLVGKGKILEIEGRKSDHYPVMAEFSYKR